MKISHRLDTIEENLTPRELIRCWMREAHEHGSLLAYGLWLAEQPQDALPLVRMPRRLYEASPLSRGRAGDVDDRETLRASYRDLLFLYDLHSHMNERVLRDAEELRFRTLYLKERLLRLIEEHENPWGPAKKGRPRKSRVTDKPPTEKVRVARDTWFAEVEALETEVHSLLGAARLLSGRYFQGEEMLFPDARYCLALLYEALVSLRRMERISFGDWEEKLLAMDEIDRLEEAEDEVPVPAEEPPSPAARTLAKQLVMLARTEALVQLGEAEQGAQMAAELIREVGPECGSPR